MATAFPRRRFSADATSSAGLFNCMKRSDKMKLERLLRHCCMFGYACGGSPELLVNEVANDFFQFGLLHLTSTAFILESGGLFHRILDPMGYGHLLKDIDSALNSKVGKTTLREFIRLKRNKLATHGDLSFYSQTKEIQNVTFGKRALREFESAMSALETATTALSLELRAIMR